MVVVGIQSSVRLQKVQLNAFILEKVTTLSGFQTDIE